jgi:LmbE family N-acetylglucosaminyl deacetylase
MNRDMTFFGKNVLFVGAHPDDIEIGCGAFIAHIAKHTNILCVTLSDNQKNPELKNIIAEHYRSMEILGVQSENVVVRQFVTRRFPTDRQEILEYLFSINKSFQPEIVSRNNCPRL